MSSFDLSQVPCQEASIHSREQFIPCGRKSADSKLVWHQKDRRAYVMCPPCADHNIRNRGGMELTPLYIKGKKTQ